VSGSSPDRYGGRVSSSVRLCPRATTGGPFFYPERRRPQLAWGPDERPAPEFSLRDQRGETISLASLAGLNPILVAFLNTRCTDICPVQGRQLSELSTMLPQDRRPTVIAISVNPDDTPATARLAARSWEWQGLDWHWLMGAKDALAPIWRAYGILARSSDAQGQVDHTGALYLLDANGDVRAAYTVPVPVARLLGDIETLEGA
jgi:cytochrome oxidase Cu insertion factor (SCO1/SenC/PrrC family)